MDIWTLISIGCAIYLIWFYRRRRKLIKEAQEELKKAEKAIDDTIQQINKLAEEVEQTKNELKKQ